MQLSNMAWGVTGHSFDCIDEETRNAIIYDLGDDFLSEADIESIVRTLYYKPYYEGDELCVRYTIPDLVFEIYRHAKTERTVRAHIEHHKCVAVGKLTIPTSTKPKGQAFGDLNRNVQQKIADTLQETLFISCFEAKKFAETLFYSYDPNKEEISFEISLFLVALATTLNSNLF